MTLFWLVTLPAVLAGLIQGVCGFGAGILLMIFLPHLLPIPQSAGVSAAIISLLCLSMTIKYRKQINYRQTFLPIVVYLSGAAGAIFYAAKAETNVFQLFLGLLLVGLTIYFKFFDRLQKFKLSPLGGLLYLLLAGVVSGLFGTGGVLSVIYFLSHTKDQEEYLGTSQFFFLTDVAFTTGLRVSRGILTTMHVPYVLCGMVGILLGLFAANKIVGKINSQRLRQWTYSVIGVVGCYYILSYFL